jgi:hypothetical protein
MPQYEEPVSTRSNSVDESLPQHEYSSPQDYLLDTYSTPQVATKTRPKDTQETVPDESTTDATLERQATKRDPPADLASLYSVPHKAKKPVLELSQSGEFYEPVQFAVETLDFQYQSTRDILAKSEPSSDANAELYEPVLQYQDTSQQLYEALPENSSDLPQVELASAPPPMGESLPPIGIHASMTDEACEAMLRQATETNGADCMPFMLRASDHGLFILSSLHGQPYHYTVHRQSEDAFTVDGVDSTFTSLSSLIEHVLRGLSNLKALAVQPNTQGEVTA